MAYIPNKADPNGRSNWQPGDRLTPENLNHIENGIVDISKKVDTVPNPTASDAGKAIVVDEFGRYSLGDVASADSYTKAETDALLAEKADTSSVYTKVETDNKLSLKVDLLLTAPVSDNLPGHFAVVYLNAEPAHRYSGYLYVVETPEEPGYIIGNTVILGTNDEINGDAIALGTSSVANNTIIL
ncbi:MAG: hypothetical protein J6W64_00080 [Bacilli bacterium]|nr:hypothetical protein [Bacilli bacterium]